MRRLTLVLPLIALVTGCGQQPETRQSRETAIAERTTQDSQKFEASESAADASAAGPNIGINSAPGIAFNYRYAFRLPNAKIATVQEQHAQLCEKLGINRCRITGLRYQLVDEDEVSAMLAFKLDPAVARQFGKDGIASVVAAEGMVVDSEISGVDAGSDIKAADKTIAQYQDDLNRIEAQLKQSLSNEERVRLTDEAATLRAEIRSTSDGRAASKESLATTPMVFNYGSGRVIPGFDGASPLSDAAKTAISSFLTMLGFILIATGALLPWLGLGALCWWLWRKFAKPLVTASQPTTAAE